MTVGLAMLTGAVAAVLAYVDWPALVHRPAAPGPASVQAPAPGLGGPRAEGGPQAQSPTQAEVQVPTQPETRGAARETSAPVEVPAGPALPAATFVPSFDIVRVTPQGSAVIAGRAEPMARVTVWDGDRKLGETTADGHGEFVLVPERRLTAGGRELTLSARDGAGREVRGTDRVVILVPEVGAVREAGGAGSERAVTPAAPLATLTAPPMGPATPGVAAGSGVPVAGSVAPAIVAAGVTPPVVAAGVTPPGVAGGVAPPGVAGGVAPPVVGTATVPAPAPIALLVPQDPRAPSRLLQAPKPAVLDPSRPLSLDTVDYDSQGEIRFSGTARPTGPVRVYVDNRPVADASVAGTGSWTVTPTERVAPGVHQLRVDQLASNGSVQNRVEMPFERTELPASSLPPDRLVVQPGANLWRIARQTYGQGARYTVIYVANKEQIRDPQRIYPGQVLTLPAKN